MKGFKNLSCLTDQVEIRLVSAAASCMPADEVKG